MAIPHNITAELVTVLRTFSDFSDEIHSSGPPKMFDDDQLLAYLALDTAICELQAKITSESLTQVTA